VDSLQYRFSFAIENLAQVPADFVLPPDLATFDSGVFLPRDDADWLGRRGYPARILLLRDREALVVSHPASGAPQVRVPLDGIERLEWGRILLTGWVALTWNGGQIQLPYNTRARGAVEKCIRTLEDRWLPAKPAQQAPLAATFGEPLDVKFEYARSAEQLPGEVPARLASIAAVRRICADKRDGLEIAFRYGDAWHIPLRENQKQEAQRFPAALEGL
jgi:hypothetical protein